MDESLLYKPSLKAFSFQLAKGGIGPELQICFFFLLYNALCVEPVNYTELEQSKSSSAPYKGISDRISLMR